MKDDEKGRRCPLLPEFPKSLEIQLDKFSFSGYNKDSTAVTQAKQKR